MGDSNHSTSSFYRWNNSG